MSGHEDEAGFVFAATGDKYVTLARRAARSLRQVMPEAQIDLFTDADLRDEVFDRIHTLERANKRPKIEALRRSRFGRTICLDADIIVVADLQDAFDLLDRFDFAGTHGMMRNAQIWQRGRSTAPPSFAMINSGVIALRRSPASDRFLDTWTRLFKNAPDQPSLREALWTSEDLRIGVLPIEYNLMRLSLLSEWTPSMPAPRVLHITDLHKRNPGRAEDPLRMEDVLPPSECRFIRTLIAADAALGGRPPRDIIPRRPGLTRRKVAAPLRRLLQLINNLLRRAG